MGDVVEANIALARRGYEMWNTGGVEALVNGVYAPDVVYHDVPDFPDGGVFHGRAAVTARLSQVVEAIGHFQMNVRSVEGRGDHVLVASDVTATGAGSGAPVMAQAFHVYRGAGGWVSEVRAFVDEDQARREYERLTSAPTG